MEKWVCEFTRTAGVGILAYLGLQRVSVVGSPETVDKWVCEFTWDCVAGPGWAEEDQSVPSSLPYSSSIRHWGPLLYTSLRATALYVTEGRRTLYAAARWCNITLRRTTHSSLVTAPVWAVTGHQSFRAPTGVSVRHQNTNDWAIHLFDD